MELGTDETKDGYVNANCRGQRIFKLRTPMQKVDRPESAERRLGRAVDGKKNPMAALLRTDRDSARPDYRTEREQKGNRESGY
jgi:hypothetical protein